MFKDILLPVDLSDPSSWRKALPVVVAQCRAFGARLHVITVVPDFGMSIVSQYFPEGYEEKVGEAVMQALQDFVRDHVPGDIKVQHIVAEGNIYEQILDAARNVGCDLIVMGAHRPELKDYLLGPVPARVVRHARCSVMVVREDDHG